MVSPNFKNLTPSLDLSFLAPPPPRLTWLSFLTVGLYPSSITALPSLSRIPLSLWTRLLALFPLAAQSSFLSMEFPYYLLSHIIEIFRKLIYRTDVPVPIIKLLTLYLSYNFCSSQFLIYFFLKGVGVPIGSFLGSTVSEVFLRQFKDELFHSGTSCKHIVYWHRHIDDVLCLRRVL